MKNDINLVLSRKQAVFLLWLVDSVFDFLESFEKLDFKIDFHELRDFRDFVYLNIV